MQEKSDRYDDAYRAMRRKTESRRRRRIAEHDGKERLTRENALVFMHRVAEETGLWMTAYPCTFCDAWHVGKAWKSLKDWAPNPDPRPEIEGITQSLGDLFGDQLKKLLEEES